MKELYFFGGFKRAGQQVRHHCLGDVKIIHTSYLLTACQRCLWRTISVVWRNFRLIAKIEEKIVEELYFFGVFKRAG